jgi:topoisomerase-4 subunit A
VLPAAFPNLLANGSQGIAVGMATNIPPHNVAEICDCLEHIAEEPNCSHRDAGENDVGTGFPDRRPSGVNARDHCYEAYRTGRGSFRMRAKWVREELKGGGYQIVVTEIPYQVQKSKLVERLADLITTKKIPMLDDVQDESAEDIRVVLTPRSRNVEPELLMEALFRNSDLETRFSLNMNVLDKGITPRVMSLKEVLQMLAESPAGSAGPPEQFPP